MYAVSTRSSADALLRQDLETASNVLNTRITTVSGALHDADVVLDTRITNTSSGLQSQITDEIAARKAADDAEIANRTAADTAESTARSAADTAEESARIAGDNTLQNNINAEASTRATNDASEASIRANADTQLGKNLTSAIASFNSKVAKRIRYPDYANGTAYTFSSCTSDSPFTYIHRNGSSYTRKSNLKFEYTATEDVFIMYEYAGNDASATAHFCVKIEGTYRHIFGDGSYDYHAGYTVCMPLESGGSIGIWANENGSINLIHIYPCVSEG